MHWFAVKNDKTVIFAKHIHGKLLDLAVIYYKIKLYFTFTRNYLKCNVHGCNNCPIGIVPNLCVGKFSMLLVVHTSMLTFCHTGFGTQHLRNDATYTLGVYRKLTKIKLTKYVQFFCKCSTYYTVISILYYL